MADVCCCGISLRKGTIIIGVCTIFFTFLSILVWGILLSIVAVSIVRNDLLAGSNSTLMTIILVSFSFSALINIGHFVMALLLVRGAQRQESRLIRMYLIYGTTMIVLSLISTALTVVSNAAFVIPVILVFALEAYFLIVIWNYYRELKDKPASESDVDFTPGPKTGGMVPNV